MENMSCTYRGCLLGLAVGDALGQTINEQSWDQIRENYGPNGLLGYDLQAQEYAQITSYTQIAAFLCNGLLLGVSRGKTNHLRYSKLAIKEWTRSQLFYRDPEPSFCWVAKLRQFRRNQCRDIRMLETLRQENFGSMDNPKNNACTPGMITAAIAAGMFYHPKRIAADQVGRLAAELISLTHGNPETILSGVTLSYAIAGILHDPEQDLSSQFLQAIDAMDCQFRSRFPQAESLAQYLREVVMLAQEEDISAQAGMEQMRCADADQCLAGAMFACLQCPEDFDGAIITAVNHSGLSTAVGAITGAILGAKLGEQALPEFYLESLECGNVLQTLAEDMLCATPALGLFDDTWDHKYVQGLPPEGMI